MKIAGFQKSSFVDYPSIMACVVFTPGCNMRCGYCHNKHILGSDAPSVDGLAVMEYLQKRRGMLKGVVITGGEPTLRPDLEVFIKRVKEMGYKVKLDTNGTQPDRVHSLVGQGLIDYIAMDIKANKDKYSLVAGCNIDFENIMSTVEYIKSTGIPHEFRTTFCPELTKEDILEISRDIVGDSDYYLQQYRQVEGQAAPHSREYVEETGRAVKENGGKCIVRGL